MPLFNPPPSSGAGSGTVTSVDVAAPAPLSSSGGPISTSGTVTLSWAGSQTANRVLASPNGSSGAVALRALVAGDVPAVNPSALTGSGTVPLAALSGITTSQLDAAAGILSAQIAALATSKLTGTIGASQLAVSAPSSGQLGGLTTGNLSASAGILGSQLSASAALGSGQIASVSAATITGTNTLPDGVLSTNVPLLNAANSFSAAQTLGASNALGALLGTPAQSAPSVSSGGSLGASTTYFYVVTALDPFGRETVQSGEQSASTTSSNKTITVTWTAVAGAMGYRVYRSTTSGAYTSASYYKVVNALTKADTGAAADGTATPPSSTAGYGWRLDPAAATPTLIANTMTASANYGLLNLGSGPFDGTSTGKFAGSSSGTHLALNAASGYAGTMLEAQLAGVSKFKVDSTGSATAVAGSLGFQTGSARFDNNGQPRLIDNTGNGWILGSTGGPALIVGGVAGLGTAASVVPLIARAQNSAQTGDLFQAQDNGAHTQFGVMNGGSGGSPIWALRVRATANAESMAVSHTIGAATGKAIQVFDDAGTSLGYIALYS